LSASANQKPTMSTNFIENMSACQVLARVS
jgi:hypothetical protein